MCGGETDRAAELLTESFSWWERSGDAYGHAIARSLLGGVYVSQGRYDEAAPLFTANEAYFRDTRRTSTTEELARPRALSPRRDRLGTGGRCARPQPAARRRGALRSFRRAVDAIDPLRYLGLIACAAGDLDDAARWFREEVDAPAPARQPPPSRWGWPTWPPSPRRARRGSPRCASLPRRRRCSRPRPRRSPCRPVTTTSGRMLVRGKPWATAAQAAAAAGRALTLEQALAEAEAVLELDRVRDSGEGCCLAQERRSL